MLGFGNNKKKKEEEEEKARQEQVGQAMKTMSDQIASQAQMIKQLQEQLKAAKADDAADSAANTAANRALAQAQAQLKQMQEQMEKMKAETKAKAEAEAEDDDAQAGKAAAASGGAAAGALGGAKAGPAAGAKPVEGAGLPPVTTVTGGLSVGVTAYVQKAGGKNLRLRDDPGLESRVLDGLAPGTQLELLAGPVEKDGYPWWQIRTQDGRKGWVAGSELVSHPE